MHFIRAIFDHLSKSERTLIYILSAVLLLGLIGRLAVVIQEKTELVPARGGSWKEGVVGQPMIINPVFSTNQTDQDISTLVYESLYNLLSSQKTSEDGNVYTLTLKQGLKWDDGKPLTSDDVVFTIETIQNPDIHSLLFKNWQGIMVERISELQVKLILPAKYAFFEENLKRIRIIPKHIWENIPVGSSNLSIYALQPVGNGPFSVRRIEKRRDGFITSIRLLPNSNYHAEKPYLKNFTIVFYETEETAYKSLQLLKIDGFGTATPPNGKSMSQTEIEKVPMTRYYAVFLNTAKNPPLKDKMLRMALERATPKEKMKNEIWGGEAFVINSPIIWEKLNNENVENKFNPEVAKELLEASKEENVKIILTVPDTPLLVKTAEVIKENWEAIGIEEVKIKILNPKDIFESAIKTGEYEAIIFGNILENPKDLFSFWHSSQRGYPGLNLSFFSNKNVDILIEEVRSTTDENTLRAQLDSLELFITNEVPAIFLYSPKYLYMHKKQLYGFEITENGGVISSPSERFWNVANWHIKKTRAIK